MKVRNLKKTYKTKEQSVTALNGVSFDLPEKGMVFILGKSGSGKSTLLNVLSGLDKSDEGKIEVCGRDITKLSENELSNYRNTCCGFIFQEYNLIPELNVGENIMLSLQLQGEKNAEEKLKKTLEQVELSGYENRKITELSGGQKQRIAIARAIIKNPQIIFADEPTGALDEQTGNSIFELLKNLSKEKLIIVVSHDRDFAQKYADRIIELADGKIISDNGAGEVWQSATVIEFKKPKLPAKSVVKIGCSNFKYHPVRLIATILLSVFAFTFFGVSVNIATANTLNSYVQAVYDNGIEYTAVYKYLLYDDPNQTDLSLDRFLGADNLRLVDMSFTQEDAEIFSGYDGAIAYVYDRDIYSFQKQINATSVEIISALESDDSSDDINVYADGYIYMSQSALSELGFSVTGRLPQNSSEVALNECLLNIFIKFGMTDEDGEVYQINSAEDIIGKRITINHSGSADNYKTITGVVDTGCDKQCRDEHPEQCYHEKIFVSEDYFDTFTYALFRVDSNFKNFAEAVDSYYTDNIVFRFKNDLSSDYYRAEELAVMLKMLCIYLGIIFLVFALILFTNFIATSIRGQMKQIGNLSSAGADFKQLVKVYFGSSLGICGIVYLLSIALVAVGVAVVNAYIKYNNNIVFNMISFNPVVLLILIAAAVIAAFLGCIIPLLKLRKSSPIDLINKGQIK